MAPVVGARSQQVDHHNAWCVARGDGVGLWWIEGDRLPNVAALTRISRATRVASGAHSVLLCSTAGPGTEVLAAVPVLGSARLARRRLDGADAKAVSGLAKAGVRGSDTAEGLVLELEDFLRRKPIGAAFVKDFRAAWREMAAAWTGVPQNAKEARRELALRTLSRVLFLAFVEARGWLDGRPRFLEEEASVADAEGKQVYSDFLCTLFFGVLNTPVDQRKDGACALGTIPYLNGGLFCEDRLERAYPERGLPNSLIRDVLDRLFARYVFCASETQVEQFLSARKAGESPRVIDPEMLGRVFEALMADDERGSSGSYYTPRHLVAQIVNDALCAFGRDALDPPGAAWADDQKRLHNGTLKRALHALFVEGDASAFEAEDAGRLDDALRRVRILDPAAGSGAFIIGAFDALLRARQLLQERAGRHESLDTMRRHIATHNLFAVDILPSAVRLCELRLWLALSVGLDVDLPEDVPPLPNLDLSLRQGDSLLELHDVDSVLAVRAATDAHASWALAPRAVYLLHHKNAYLDAVGTRKATLATAIERGERRVFDGLLDDAIMFLKERVSAFERLATAPTLFGEPRGLRENEKDARRTLEERVASLQKARNGLEKDAQPYFAFGLHFWEAMREGGFDMVVGNPPWVRPHRLPKDMKQRIRRRYRVCHHAAWRTGARLGHGIKAGQVDLAAVFVERALHVARPGGVVALLIPAKLFGSLSAGAFRRVVAEQADVLSIVDWSRSPQRLFGATTYPGLLIVQKKRMVRRPKTITPKCSAPTPSHPAASRRPSQPSHRKDIDVTVVKRDGRSNVFRVMPEQLAFATGDTASPWVLLPPRERAMVSHLQQSGEALGQRCSLRRGVVTGANSVFVSDSAIAEPGSATAAVRFPGGYDAVLETSCLRPSLRGADIAPYAVSPSRVMLFPHDDEGAPLPALPPRVAHYLGDHRDTLLNRADLRGDVPCWTLFRVRPDTFGPKVVWRDISTRLEAAYVPAMTDHALCGGGAVIPLNTVYYVPVRSADEGYLLTALLNSKQARSFADAVAEHARGGYRRYFSWVVGLIPWPFDHVSPVLITRLVRASQRLHGHAGPMDAERRMALLERVDALVEEAYADAARVRCGKESAQ